jgi:hypothetical protein
MVPLYAARVQDLGTDDFVVIKCGACGHTAEIPPSGRVARIGGTGATTSDLSRLTRYGRRSGVREPAGG